MKLHDLWTVTAEEEIDGILVVEGKMSEEAPIKQYFVKKNPEANKGQWEIVQANAAHKEPSKN